MESQMTKIELRARLEAHGLRISEEEGLLTESGGRRGELFRISNGGVVSVFKTGTVLVQGKNTKRTEDAVFGPAPADRVDRKAPTNGQKKSAHGETRAKYGKSAVGTPCPRCGYTRFKVTLDTLKEVLRGPDPRLLSIPEVALQKKRRAYAICPKCDSRALGSYLPRGFPFTDGAGRQFFVQDLDKLGWRPLVPIADLAGLPEGSEVIVAGYLSDVALREVGDREMAFVRLKDQSGTVEVVVFATLYAKRRRTFKEGNHVAIGGKRTVWKGRLQVQASAVVAKPSAD